MNYFLKNRVLAILGLVLILAFPGVPAFTSFERCRHGL
jgi:hypothetical protein